MLKTEKNVIHIYFAVYCTGILNEYREYVGMYL